MFNLGMAWDRRRCWDRRWCWEEEGCKPESHGLLVTRLDALIIQPHSTVIAIFVCVSLAVAHKNLVLKPASRRVSKGSFVLPDIEPHLHMRWYMPPNKVNGCVKWRWGWSHRKSWFRRRLEWCLTMLGCVNTARLILFWKRSYSHELSPYLSRPGSFGSSYRVTDLKWLFSTDLLEV